MWGAGLPGHWEVVDTELMAVAMYLENLTQPAGSAGYRVLVMTRLRQCDQDDGGGVAGRKQAYAARQEQGCDI